MAWIGGSIFMMVLGFSLKDKKKQQEVYPNIGPIFGYFEVGALAILLVSGTLMASNYGVLSLVFTADDSEIVEMLRAKLWLVFFLVIATITHFIIANKTLTTEKTFIQKILSRGSSLFIFFVNLFILHYAIMIRNIIN
jgi:uncharacterized membrane protein